VLNDFGPIKEPSKGDVNGEVTCCMIPVVLDLGFDVFDTLLVPSACAADSVRFKIIATSVGPTTEAIVPVTPALSIASEECR